MCNQVRRAVTRVFWVVARVVARVFWVVARAVARLFGVVAGAVARVLRAVTRVFWVVARVVTRGGRKGLFPREVYRGRRRRWRRMRGRGAAGGRRRM